MQRTLLRLKYLLTGFLVLVILSHLILMMQYHDFREGEVLFLLVPFLFIITLFPSRQSIWVGALVVSVFGIVDVFYWSSYSATPPRMMFTLPLVFYFQEVYWLKRMLEIISVVFYPVTFVILILPGVRKKYFSQ